MNPVTSFLVFACLAAGLAAGYLVSPYLAFPLLAAAALIAMSLNWKKCHGRSWEP